MRVLQKEGRRVAREVTGIPEVTGGCPATIYQFLDGSVGYFALGTLPWQEAGEITGEALLKFKRMFDGHSMAMVGSTGLSAD